jgi:hypothetical protein
MARRRSTQCFSVLPVQPAVSVEILVHLVEMTGARLLADNHVCIWHITAGYGTTATTLPILQISVSSSFCLFVTLKEHLPGKRLAINADANYLITSSLQTMARMETIVLLHCRGRKSGVYLLLPRAIRNKVFGVSVLVTVCFKTPVHTVRHARNTPVNALPFFGLSPCSWMRTKTCRSGAERATQHHTGRPRAAWKLRQSAHTSGTILDRVLCFLHLFNSLFFLPTDGKMTHPVEKQKTGRTKIMTVIMLMVVIWNWGNKVTVW